MICQVNIANVIHVTLVLNVIRNVPVTVHVTMVHVIVVLQVGGEITVRRLDVPVYMVLIVPAMEAVSLALPIL